MSNVKFKSSQSVHYYVTFINNIHILKTLTNAQKVRTTVMKTRTATTHLGVMFVDVEGTSEVMEPYVNVSFPVEISV